MFKIDEKRNKKNWSKEEQKDVFLSFSGTKRNKRFCSKKNSDRRQTDKGIPKLFRNGEKRTDLFQNYSDRRGANRSVPKLFRNVKKRTDLFPKISERRKTNRFDSDLEEEKSEKDESSSLFGTKAKSKGFDP